MWPVRRTLPGLVAGIALIDVGVQSGHVANQSRIYALEVSGILARGVAEPVGNYPFRVVLE